MNVAALRQELAAQHVTLSVSVAGKLKYEAPGQLPAALVDAMKAHRAELLAELGHAERKPQDPAAEKPSGYVIFRHSSSVPCLPSPLASMVSAASSGNISGGAQLPSGIVVDLGAYVLAWAAAYLTGDQDHALTRLKEARGAWRQA